MYMYVCMYINLLHISCTYTMYKYILHIQCITERNKIILIILLNSLNVFLHWN